MIQPNWNIFMWFLLVSYTLSSIIMMYLGGIKYEKQNNYGALDIIAGFVRFFSVAVFLIFF